MNFICCIDTKRFLHELRFEINFCKKILFKKLLESYMCSNFKWITFNWHKYDGINELRQNLPESQTIVIYVLTRPMCSFLNKFADYKFKIE